MMTIVVWLVCGFWGLIIRNHLCSFNERFNMMGLDMSDHTNILFVTIMIYLGHLLLGPLTFVVILLEINGDS